MLQVLGEDLVLVSGQQDRMQRGADTWAHPVSYDKLAVRYRRWRNKVCAPQQPPPTNSPSSYYPSPAPPCEGLQASLKLNNVFGSGNGG